MARFSNRRQFLASTSTAAALTGAWSFLGRLPRVSAEEAAGLSGVTVDDGRVESLIKLIEDTPRERLLEEIAQRIHNGSSYREVLAALLLAGVRNVQPRPSVGFKFHCVLVVNSCHLAALSGPDEDRWLPIFWALDHFKSSQADETRQSGWHMTAVDDSKVPSPEKAREQFLDAMNRWDEEQADAATASLVRSASATEIFNLFAQYAARDFRSIGHKAIYLANSWRTLQVIGWEFAEPVLRSLAFAMLSHTDNPNPAESDQSVDRAWRTNEKLVGNIPASWLEGAGDASHDLMDAFRSATPEATGEVAAKALAAGGSAQSVWDGVFVGAGELLMRQPGIVGLHGLTTANAVHYLWKNAADESLRKQMLLQACSFNAYFRDAAQGRGELPNLKVDELEPVAGSPVSLDEIVAHISVDKMQAAAELRRFLKEGGDPQQFVAATRRMIFLKGRDAHDYKFSSAVLEDYANVSPQWRDQFLALSVFNLKGSEDRDNGLVERTRAALQA